MATLEHITDRLREDFKLTLSDERIVELVNELEAMLSVNYIKKKQRLKLSLNGSKTYETGIDESRITKVFKNGKEIFKANDFSLSGIFINIPDDNGGALEIEYIVCPLKLDLVSAQSRELMLKEENHEIYIYYILSRAALAADDSPRFNNYNLLYTEALNRFALNLHTEQKTIKFKNIW